MTAYELRISDWSSDVCSSDLLPLLAWGYPRAVDRWYALLDRIEAEALPVANPVPVLRWNSDKAYLTELGARDVAVVPTIAVAALDEAAFVAGRRAFRSEEHTSALQSLLRTSCAVFCVQNNRYHPPVATH